MTIHRLRKLKRLLPSLGEDGEWLAFCIENYEEGAPSGLRFDAVCGLVPGRGQSPWWELENLEKRRNLIATIAKQFNSPNISQQAEEIENNLSRYQDGRWRFDKDKAAIAGDEKHKLLHGIMQLSDGKAPSKDTIKRALNKKHEIPDFVPTDMRSNNHKQK